MKTAELTDKSITIQKMKAKTRLEEIPYEVRTLRDMESSSILMNMSRSYRGKRKERISKLIGTLQEKKTKKT